MEGPIRVKDLGDVAHEMPTAQDKSEIRQITFRSCFRDLILVSKERNEY
jgi:hypothetical protein